MSARLIEFIPPNPPDSKMLVMPHTLWNGILRSRLLSALFGRAESPGYLSPLGFIVTRIDLAVKMQASLLSLVETFSPHDSRVISALRMAAEALRLEIFRAPWTENRIFPEGKMEAFSWKTTSKKIPAFIKECEAILDRIERPLFGGLPQLAAELIEIAELPGPEQQQAELSHFLTSIDPAKPTDSILGLLALLREPRFIPRARIDEVIAKFRNLKPMLPLPDQEAAVLEARAYVMGVVIRATKSVTAYRQNWFAYLGLAPYHTEEIRELMVQMGFESEWRSFDLEFKEAHQTTVAKPAS